MSSKQHSEPGAADKPRGWVALVGAGPGDEGLLTVRAAELLAAADLVVAGPEHHALAQRFVSAHAQLAEPADGTPAVIAKQLTAPAKAGQLVVRLYQGDPLLSGAAQDAAACAKAGVRFEIIAGVPPHIAVPGAAGIALAGPNAGELRIIHASEASRVAYSPATLIVLGADAGPADLAKMLIANGWPEATRLAITWDGTTSAQQTVSSTLGHIGPDLKAAGISLANTQGQAIAVVGDVVASRERLSWFETKPLFGWRVLVPRTKEQAAAVSERLREYGAVPEEVPTIAVEPPRTPQQMERAVKGLVTGRYQWVAFTSANAVRAVRERFEEYGLDARAFAGVKIAAVGEQTAKSLLDFGIRPDLVPSGEQSAEGLANEWPPYDDLLDPINRVLLPRADIATETLLAKLTDLGWECEDVTAYRTVRAAPPPAPIREAIKGGGFDAVLFTSSSTVRNLVGIAGKPHAVTVIGVIGPQTAKTAAEFGLRVDVTAPSPSMTALVDAMAEYGRGLQEAAAESGEQLRRPSERRRGGRRRR
ncbi:MAG TPA: uroporphyrinogen-III synthase [Streptosporangiaceae bacterium]|nr:uroporphyrinogen-III synthase [Streptosporangiaceae bacterium]